MMIKNFKFLLRLIILTSFFFINFSTSFAAKKVKEVDYFASLRSGETNVRSGPGKNYQVKFTYKLSKIPVHVISEYDNWNEIEDYDGQTGWVSQSLLTKRKMLMVRTNKDFVNMHSKANEKSRIIFRLENKVIGNYIKCRNDWCALKVKNKKGWVKRSNLWG